MKLDKAQRAYQLLHRHTPLSRHKALAKIDQVGAEDAIEWADSKYNVLDKASRDDHHEDNGQRSGEDNREILEDD